MRPFEDSHSSTRVPPDNPLSKWFLCPQRLILRIMSALGILLCYAFRLTVSVAIATQKLINNITVSAGTCPVSPHDIEETDHQSYKHRLGHEWTFKQENLFISSFHWAYGLVNFLSGYLVDRYGGKHFVTFALIGSSMVTILQPVLMRVRKGRYFNILGSRILHGAFQGAFLPSLFSMASKWSPKNERTLNICFICGASSLGSILARLTGVSVINETTFWESIFYVFGGLGLTWVALWNIFCYSKPDNHPCISRNERSYLKDNLDQVHIRDFSVPWSKILTSRTIWVLIITNLGYMCLWSFIYQHMYRYLNNVLKVDIVYDENWAVIPHSFLWITSITFGCVSDWLIIKKHVNVTLVRKICTCTSMIGAATTLLLASFARCNRAIALTYFSVAVAFAGGYFAGAYTSILDIAPNFAGSIVGVVNGSGAVMSIVVPILLGVMTPNNTLSEWKIVFWAIFFVVALTGVVYLMKGEAREEGWNRIRH